MGRRLVVLGSAPAFEEVADEEGVEEAITSVVRGSLLFGVFGGSGAGTGCKEKRELCGEGFRSPAHRRRLSGQALKLPLKCRCGKEKGEGGQRAGWVGVHG